jgi:hypothetical protein
MPKETLKTLDRDAGRLLFVGAQAARGDSALETARAKLAPLGPKAPAIAKVVEQVEKVQKAAPKAAAAELLNLAGLMAQVRGAQAAPLAVPEGGLEPLPTAEPIGSPLSSVELSALVGALTGAADARHRPRTIADAVGRGAVRDLRLLPFCVAALGDSGISYVVESQLLPMLGNAVVPELRASLKLQGRAVDAKKLRALARIEGKATQPLLMEAVEKGSPELRAAAISALAGLDMAVAEPIALKLLDGDRSADVKRAAATALAGGRSDAALDALLKAFLESEELRNAAGGSLATLQHPRATERALALVTPELLALGPFKAQKASAKAAKQKAEREHQAQVALLHAVLDLLAARQGKDTSAAVLQVFREHKLKEVRESAARALLKSGYEGAFDELAPSVIKAGHGIQSEFIDGIIDREPARAFERLGRFLDRAALKSKEHIAFAGMILSYIEYGSDGQEEPVDEETLEASKDAALQRPSVFRTDPRWTDAAIALIAHPELGSKALDVIAVAKPPQALEPVLKLAASAKKTHAWNLANVLSEYRDPRIPPLLVGLLDLLGNSWMRRRAYQTIRSYDDPAFAPLLSEWMKRKKRLEKGDKGELTELVQFLQRDRSLTAGV